MPKKKKVATPIRQIKFGEIDFGHFVMGGIPNIGPYHFDLGDFGNIEFGRHDDDPWHGDRQFLDRGHGDNHNDSHNDQHADDPDYPDDGDHTDRFHDDQPHTDRHGDHNDAAHNDGHADNHNDGGHSDGFHNDGGHVDYHSDSDNHNDHNDAHDDISHNDDAFQGVRFKQFSDALNHIQSAINMIVRQQQQTIKTTELHLTGMAKKITVAFDQAFKDIANLESRIQELENRGDSNSGERPPK